MKLTALGEFGLISRLEAIVHRRAKGLLVGIGDDAAVWECSNPQVATTDILIEGVHFVLDSNSWRDLGWKAVAVNLSDLAAMGSLPRHILVSLGLPATTDVSRVEELYHGAAEVSDLFGAVVVGGDTVRSPNGVVISVAAIGEATVFNGQPRLLRRDRAKVGDVIGVSGVLGGSAGGLEVVLKRVKLSGHFVSTLKSAHSKPIPRVPEAQVLLAAGVEAAMDISDGLIGDLAKLCTASGVAAVVDVAQVPVMDDLALAFPDRSVEMALYGGEDYELLFSAPPQVFALVRERLRQGGLAPATAVGEIIAGRPGSVVLRKEGRAIESSRAGYDAFSPSEW